MCEVLFSACLNINGLKRPTLKVLNAVAALSHNDVAWTFWVTCLVKYLTLNPEHEVYKLKT